MFLLFALLSIFAGGLFLLDLFLIGGAVIFLIWGLRSWKSGSVVGGSSNNPERRYSDSRVPVYKVWQFVFATLLIIAEIVTIIVRIREL